MEVRVVVLLEGDRVEARARGRGGGDGDDFVDGGVEVVVIAAAANCRNRSGVPFRLGVRLDLDALLGHEGRDLDRRGLLRDEGRAGGAQVQGRSRDVGDAVGLRL